MNRLVEALSRQSRPAYLIRCEAQPEAEAKTRSGSRGGTDEVRLSV